jgi:predicted RNA-binding protein YlxR (DUF448 family)
VGKLTNLKRIDGKYIIHEIEQRSAFERGIYIHRNSQQIRQNIRKYFLQKTETVKPIYSS